jgi:uncharacterized protein YacL
MNKRPKSVLFLVLLWLSLSAIFILWGVYSLIILLQTPSWQELQFLLAPVHFGYLMSTIVWFVFSSIFVIFSYGTFKKDMWVWTTGLIFSTIFLVIFALMLATFMINALMFRDFFSIAGLVTVVLTFIIDLGIVFFLTRPDTKFYFENDKNNKIKDLL